MYIPLATKSAYSLLESTIRLPQYVQKAHEYHYEALGLMDHNTLHGTIEFYQLCQKAKIKPIIGLLLDISFEDEMSYPFYFVAKSFAGYQQLMELSTKKMLGESPIMQEEQRVTDVAILIPKETAQTTTFSALLENKHSWLSMNVTDVFFCVTPTNLGEKDFYSYQEKMKDLGMRPIACQETVAMDKSENTAIEVVTHIKDSSTFDWRSSAVNEKAIGVLRPAEEMDQAFQKCPEALEELAELVALCQFELPLHQVLLPKYPVPNGESAKDYLAYLCKQGLASRQIAHTSTYQRRLDYELRIIHQMGFDDYFLIVWDIMNFAHEQNIVTGAGRGSAAGSLVSYLLSITEIDPIDADLLFERFLNPERYTMPDIDLDIPDNRRDVILHYVKEKYGADYVAQIATFGTMAAKMVLRDVARTFGLSQSEMNRWSKAIPNQLKITLKEAYQTSKSLRELVEMNEKNRLLFQIASQLEGLPRHVSTHAAGVVISDTNLRKLVPLQAGSGELYLTQFAMNDVETVGLLKMDFLGLRNLSIIDDTLKGIYYQTKQSFTQAMIPKNDKQTYELFQRGETVGVFQFESAGIRKVLRDVRPANLEELAAVNALYRPGPMKMIDTYVKRKNGLEKSTYFDQSLTPILRSTYGIMVYQEQVMQVASMMGGFSLGEADILRRAISKKKRAVLDEQREKFYQGAQMKGYNRKIAEATYQYIERFADYGFNRSHAFAYSEIAYQMAYLKTHYPVPFYRALLQSVQGNASKMREYISEAKRQGVVFLAPSINASYSGFSIESSEGIRFGLASIKGLRKDFTQAVIQERKERGPFKSMDHFLLRLNQLNPKYIKKEILEPLIEVGAFDTIEPNRKQLLQELEGKRQNLAFSGGSMDMLALMPLKTTEVVDFTLPEKLTFEENLLGVYVSGHPIQEYDDLRRKWQTTQLSDLVPGTTVLLLGYLKNIREIRTKKGEKMAFLDIMDLGAERSVTLFPELYRRVQRDLLLEHVYLIEGKVETSRYNGEVQLLAQKLQLAASVRKDTSDLTCYLKIDKHHEEISILNQLSDIIKEYSGECFVILYYESEKKQKRLPADLKIKNNSKVAGLLEKLLGKENVIFK